MREPAATNTFIGNQDSKLLFRRMIIHVPTAQGKCRYSVRIMNQSMSKTQPEYRAYADQVQGDEKYRFSVAIAQDQRLRR